MRRKQEKSPHPNLWDFFWAVILFNSSSCFRTSGNVLASLFVKVSKFSHLINPCTHLFPKSYDNTLMPCFFFFVFLFSMLANIYHFKGFVLGAWALFCFWKAGWQRKTGREEKRERVFFLPRAASFPNIHNIQAQARSQKFHLGFPQRCRGPKELGYHLFPSQGHCEELGQEKGS